jgi:uncharacterized membrane protein
MGEDAGESLGRLRASVMPFDLDQHHSRSHLTARPAQTGNPAFSGGAVSMPTTAWRFAGTEGADTAVTKLKKLDSQELINVVDVAVLRWPEYASEPTTQEHVTEEGGKVASLVRRFQHPVIEGSMIDSVKGDLRPGTSAMVLLSSDAQIDAVVHAFEGQPIELIRTDLSVPDQDRLRIAVDQARRGNTT